MSACIFQPHLSRAPFAGLLSYDHFSYDVSHFEVYTLLAAGFYSYWPQACASWQPSPGGKPTGLALSE